MSGASEQANGRASGPVLQSVFLAVFDHSSVVERSKEKTKRTISKQQRDRRNISAAKVRLNLAIIPWLLVVIRGFTQKIWHYGTPNHSPEEPQRKRKNGDIMLTRPGQIRENTKTAERTTPWQKYERQKKTGGKEEREKRIFEQENHQMAPLKTDAIFMGTKKPLPPC